MAINTQTMAGKVVEEASAPEGYEFKADSEGKIALKKIRKLEVKKEVKKVVEVVKSNKKRGKK